MLLILTGTGEVWEGQTHTIEIPQARTVIECLPYLKGAYELAIKIGATFWQFVQI